MESRALGAEFLGTFALVAAICGAGLFTGPTGGYLAIAVAAGFALTVMAYAVGHISGGHFNPAVTLGLVAAGRFDRRDALAYIVAQLLGGIAAAGLLYVILSGAVGGRWSSFAAISNTFGGGTGHGQFTLPATALIEVVLAALFMVVMIGATSRAAPAGFGPIAVGAALAVIHLIALPISNTAINPARATATAIFAGGTPLWQLWVFWVAPIVGGVIGGFVSAWLQDD